MVRLAMEDGLIKNLTEYISIDYKIFLLRKSYSQCDFILATKKYIKEQQ